MVSNFKHGTQTLRSTMNQGRLHVYEEMLDDLELNSVANESIQESSGVARLGKSAGHNLVY